MPIERDAKWAREHDINCINSTAILALVRIGAILQLDCVAVTPSPLAVEEEKCCVPQRQGERGAERRNERPRLNAFP